ncbi:MAG: hypothetical protein WD512_09250, partial [Candidatus Paceibacterota bacterium]
TDKIAEYKSKIIELLKKKARSQALESEGESSPDDETYRLHVKPNYQKYLNEFPKCIKTIIKSTEGIER